MISEDSDPAACCEITVGIQLDKTPLLSNTTSTDPGARTQCPTLPTSTSTSTSVHPFLQLLQYSNLTAFSCIFSEAKRDWYQEPTASGLRVKCHEKCHLYSLSLPPCIAAWLFLSPDRDKSLAGEFSSSGNLTHSWWTHKL